MRALLCSGLIVTLALVATVDTASVPPDFQINARFFPGAGSADGGPEPWRLEISADGKAVQETYTYLREQQVKHLKIRQLSQASLIEIVTAGHDSESRCRQT